MLLSYLSKGESKMQNVKVSITREELKKKQYENCVVQLVDNQNETKKNIDYTSLVELMIAVIDDKAIA